MTHQLFYVAPGALEGLTGRGDQVELDAGTTRHAVKSLRLAPGDRVLVADGTGTGGVGELVETSGPCAVVGLEELTHQPAPAPRLVLVQALAKADRDRLAVATAVELGVDAVIPWQAERSIVRLKADKTAKTVTKWQSQLLTAAQQSRRYCIPELRDPVSGTAVAELAQHRHRLVLVTHQDATEHLGETLTDAMEQAHHDGPAISEIAIVVGPEGGISQAEITALQDAGARIVVLGTHILRASTAGPAAVAVINERLGRWYPPQATG